MLTGALRIAAVLAAVVASAGLAMPAAAQLDPDDPCAADPHSVECRQRVPNPGESPGPADREAANLCGPHNGVPVPCVDQRLGFWLGTPNVVYGFGATPEVLVGCWARRSSDLPVVRPRPQWAFPIHHGDRDTGGPGLWYSLSCLGPEGVWPGDVHVAVAQVWLLTGDAPADPAPREVARRALARIGLTAPRLVLSPPATGSVALGMPIWLAVEQTPGSWGPISDTHCDRGLCVSIRAWATGVTWRVGDGHEVTCAREQNLGWAPGMSFLEPGRVGACHHFYEVPSREMDGGRYQVTATTRFRAQWSGGGRSGVFEDVTDACGPGGDAVCRSAARVLVEEIEVLVSR